MVKKITTRIQNKHDTAENWAKAINFIPLKGELIVYDADAKTYDLNVTIGEQTYSVKSSDKVRFKFGDGVSNVNALPFSILDEHSALVYKAEDGESLIIGDKETNTATTNGFVIYKATKEKQGDGSYNYYYYLINATQKLCNDFNAVLQANNKPSENIYVTDTLHTYYINNSSKFNGEYAEDMAKIYSVELVNKNEVPGGADKSYITDLYGARFIGETTEQLLKVRVSSIRKTYQNVPESPNGPKPYEAFDNILGPDNSYRYVWKPVGDYDLTSDGKIPEDLDCYEIDYTDTWDDKDLNGTKGPRESNFRISLAPELGNYLIITGSIILNGLGNKAIGILSLASGKGNISNGAKATTLGVDNYANYAAVAAGRRNKAMNKSSIALGEDNIVNGYAAVALGSDNEVNATGSGAIGEHLKTYNSGETAVGSYNGKKENRDKDGNGNPKTVALSVGGGWSEDSRRDAMTVYKDGTTKVLGHVHSGGTDITQTALDAKTTANTATTAANTANTNATKANNNANEAKAIANQATNNIKELENKTILNLGKLPEIGEVNKLYIDEQDEQWIYKVRKTPKVENVWDEIKDGDTVVVPLKPTTKPSTLKGAGTKDNPYQITNGNELAYIVRTQGNYSKLMNDIYLNDISNPNWKDTAKEWEGTKVNKQFYFSGEFDGQNYTIYGLYYDDPDDNGNTSANGNVACALFPRLAQKSEVTIKNVGMDYTYINSNSVAGALVGNFTQMTLTVDNCYFGENVWLRGKATACIGAWGQDSSTISNCYSLATQESALGGEDPFTECSMVLANIWSGKSTVTNCYSLNTPIIGRKSLTTTIENCYCTVRLKTADTDAYGIKIPKEDMTGPNALTNMPGLNSNAVGPSDNIITLPYDNLPVEVWKSSSTDEGAGISVEALQDGTIIWGVSNGIQIDSPFMATEQAKYKITTIPDYDPSTCKLIIEELLEWPEGYEAPGSCTIGFANIYMEGNELWISTGIGLIGDGMPNQYGGYKVRIERTGTPATYINDYIHPHLKSFLDEECWHKVTSKPSNNIIISSDEPNVDGYDENTIWIKPI